MSMDKLAILKKRLNENMEDYLKQMAALDVFSLMFQAPEISTHIQVHRHMAFKHSYTEQELDVYLQMDNPLEIVASQCLRYYNSLSCLIEAVMQGKEPGPPGKD